MANVCAQALLNLTFPSCSQIGRASMWVLDPRYAAEPQPRPAAAPTHQSGTLPQLLASPGGRRGLGRARAAGEAAAQARSKVLGCL